MTTLKEQIENLSDGDLLQVWQLVCELFNFHDDHVYNNDEEFFNEIWNPTPLEVARSCTYGDYHYRHEYVTFDGYGNLKSSNNIMELIDDTQIEDCVEQYPDKFEEWFDFEELETDEEE